MPTRSATPSRPSPCTRPPATGPVRPAPSTTSAYHAQLGNYGRPGRSAGRPSPCTASSATPRAKQTPGTASATPSTIGHLAEAADCYRRALGIFRELGDRYYQADALTHLGDTCHAAGEQRQRPGAWQQALAILDDLHHPDADQVRARLQRLGSRWP